MRSHNMNVLNKSMFLLLGIFFIPFAVASTAPQILFDDVRVWDGKSKSLSAATRVLVGGNTIKAIGPQVQAAPGARTIDGGGRTLMPGLIDSHVHLTHTFALGGIKGFEAATWEANSHDAEV